MSLYILQKSKNLEIMYCIVQRHFKIILLAVAFFYRTVFYTTYVLAMSEACTSLQKRKNLELFDCIVQRHYKIFCSQKVLLRSPSL